MEHNAPITFGFIEGGSIRLWEKMADLIKQAGGDVITGASAKGVNVEDFKVTGVNLRYQQENHTVHAPIHSSIKW